jgi:polyhydroxyalkanoate synthesis regulator phasin
MSAEKSLVEQVKKALNAGVDLAAKTWDEVEGFGKELAAKTKLSDTEAAKLLDRLQKSWGQTQRKMESRVNQAVKDALKKVNVATGDEVKSLKREVQALKKQLKEAQGAARAGKSKPAAKAKPKPSPKAKKA